ncbi:serine hydrolase [Curtobacterium sp. ER1/6]|uniref:serine hydrolase n=1 Tax=Curtobacterium sp. ER1/6 TaxID=1891920 RepID=UPI00166FE4A0|nr:serine hydrolase domain-containing protein [Curtobacterium sp. ER1/6]
MTQEGESLDLLAAAQQTCWGSITKGVVGTTALSALDVERPVVHYLPTVPDGEITIADLVHHTAGLPRLPSGMTNRLFTDPYRASVGAPLDPAVCVPLTERGSIVYSNLGYALLGAVLDVVHGDWFTEVHRVVLGPASISSATLSPSDAEWVAPRLFGRHIKPWAIAESPYAAAGGIWSSFEDLCRYADWTLRAGAETARTVSWKREGVTTWINREVRAAGAAILNARGVTAVVHALAQTPHTADSIASSLVERELRRRG